MVPAYLPLNQQGNGRTSLVDDFVAIAFALTEDGDFSLVPKYQKLVPKRRANEKTHPPQ